MTNETSNTSTPTSNIKDETPRRARRRVDVDLFVCQAEYYVNGRRMICGRVGCPGARLRRLCTNNDPMTYVTPELNAERQRLRQAQARRRKRFGGKDPLGDSAVSLLHTLNQSLDF